MARQRRQTTRSQSSCPKAERGADAEAEPEPEAAWRSRQPGRGGAFGCTCRARSSWSGERSRCLLAGQRGAAHASLEFVSPGPQFQGKAAMEAQGGKRCYRFAGASASGSSEMEACAARCGSPTHFCARFAPPRAQRCRCSTVAGTKRPGERTQSQATHGLSPICGGHGQAAAGLVETASSTGRRLLPTSARTSPAGGASRFVVSSSW